ncbi:hypothetical protein [Dyadobacter fanqingshengii]|uniref:hypothetical protein n=1 Tax=Dyadobacter fanqingshengii TaxID=2906443 RepID=UPI0020C1B482|nr:hypothetical protein [Dyadobacter fanqingshengii]UTM21860.1 hypothetical protein NFI81_26375 [Dyadobacter fanqingshengii]
MVYYILDLIPKIQLFSKKLDDFALIADQHWVMINEGDIGKRVFVFRRSGQLLVAENGVIEWGTWEILGNSIIINQSGKSLLFKNGFLDDTVLALKLDGTETYALLVNETRYGKEINSLNDVSQLLARRYMAKVNVPKGVDERYYDSSSRVLAQETLLNGDVIIFIATNEAQAQIIEGCKVLINHRIAPNGLYRSMNSHTFEVKEGILNTIFFVERHHQRDRSIVEIDIHRMTGLQKGCKVWINNSPAPDGIYSTGFFSSIRVQDGQIA